MRATLYWIEGISPYRLAILPRPCGGDRLSDELVSLKRAGIDVLLSLLTPAETRELELTEESSLCQVQQIVFFSLPIPDREVPTSFQEIAPLIGTLSERLKGGAV